MSFNLDDFKKVKPPEPEPPAPVIEVVFNKDGKITFSKDLSRSFLNSNGDVLPHIYSASLYTKSVEGKIQQVYIRMNKRLDEGCCSVSRIQSQGKVRINTKGCIEPIESEKKVKGKVWGGSSITVISGDGGHNDGVLIDVGKRATRTTKKNTTKKKTEPSAPAGEQATPQSPKSSGLTTNEFGAVQLK